MDKPMSVPNEPEGIEKHYRRAAKQIGELFCWCVENLKPFPPRDGEWINEVKRRLATPSPPEVIEGRGQAVTEDDLGFYLLERPSGDELDVVKKDFDDEFELGCRYMKLTLPTFPPRATFQPPERPEEYLVRVASPHLGKNHPPFWAVKIDGEFVDLSNGERLPENGAEILNKTTGKPIEGGE